MLRCSTCSSFFSTQVHNHTLKSAPPPFFSRGNAGDELLQGFGGAERKRGSGGEDLRDFLGCPLEVRVYFLCVLHSLLEAGARAGEPRLRLRLQFQELAVFGVELAGTVFVLVSCCLFESGQLGGGRLTSAPASPDSDLAGSGRSCRRSGPGYTR